jgi:hypothetical protein
MISFYLYEEAFDTEVMSWTRVKCNLHKLGMHYLLLVKILKKRVHEEGIGLSSGLEVHNKEASIRMESDEQEETQPLE